LLTYSTFINQIDMTPMIAVARKMLESAPVVELPATGVSATEHTREALRDGEARTSA
jgi:hypothetical protein